MSESIDRNIAVEVDTSGRIRIGAGRNTKYPVLEFESQDVPELIRLLRIAINAKWSGVLDLPDKGGAK